MVRISKELNPILTSLPLIIYWLIDALRALLRKTLHGYNVYLLVPSLELLRIEPATLETRPMTHCGPMPSQPCPQ